MSYTYICQFDVAPGKELEFEHSYGANGDGVTLFKTDPLYIEIELFRDMQHSDRCVTIDRWKIREAYLAFKQHHRMEFDALDVQCDALTVHEILLGKYESVE
ncbi:MAG: hypothetical protein M0R68_14070 [Bacteroidetes bacterium]|nr:hypothetical protein [Bacteroidota bacterium]